MIDIEEAIDSAKKFAKRIYAEDELVHLRVEEIEKNNNEEDWLVTLGWVEPATRKVGGFGALNMGKESIEPLPRVYKTFVVDGTTGMVESMKIRD